MKYELVKTLPNLSINSPVFADIETESLYVDVRLVQVYQPDTSDVVYILDTDILNLNEIKEWLKQYHLIFHNASYDLGTLNIVPKELDDTFYLCKLAYPSWQQYSLDVCSNYLAPELYKNIDKKAMQKARFVKGARLSQAQLTYATTDVIALSKIWQDSKIQEAREIVAYKVDILNLLYCVQYQQNGLVVHQQSVLDELAKIQEDIAENEKMLNGLNPNSPKQVKEFLGTDDSSKETLINLITNGSPEMAKIAKAVYEQRRLLKRQTFLNSYNHPILLSKFNPNGAITGRFTATGGDLPKGINAQQISRDLQYIFNKDTEDTVVVHADFSTAELRAGCSIMGDTQMYSELKAGKDLHKIAATLALGGDPENISKKDRQKGKAISFGFIFGMSAPSFQKYAFVNYGVTFTAEECKNIKTNYQNRYKQIALYAKKWWNNYKTINVSTPLGHIAKAKLGTDAINYATQGGIAETTKLAVHYLVKDYPEVLKYIYNVVHDAIYLRVPKGQENQWAECLVASMKKGWEELCKSPKLIFKDIPMPVEVEYNDYSSGEGVYKCLEK